MGKDDPMFEPDRDVPAGCLIARNLVIVVVGLAVLYWLVAVTDKALFLMTLGLPPERPPSSRLGAAIVGCFAIVLVVGIAASLIIWAMQHNG